MKNYVLLVGICCFFVLGVGAHLVLAESPANDPSISAVERQAFCGEYKGLVSWQARGSGRFYERDAVLTIAPDNYKIKMPPFQINQTGTRGGAPPLSYDGEPTFFRMEGKVWINAAGYKFYVCPGGLDGDAKLKWTK